MVVINQLYPEVIKVCRPLIIEDEALKVLVQKFSESVAKSLSEKHAHDSTVKCKLTYVTDFPAGKVIKKEGRVVAAKTADQQLGLFTLAMMHLGVKCSWVWSSLPDPLLKFILTEKGSFLGLEFSGKIFRLVYTGLKGDRSYVTLTKLYEFPNQKLNDYFSKAVDYVAKCVNNFIETYDIYERKLILGITSGFPLEQESLQEGKIMHWGKDFHFYDPTNQDFFNELKLSLKKFKNTKSIYLISLISNSTACLLAGLYKDPSVRMGLYLDNTANMTYLEKFENITICKGDGLRSRTAIGVEMRSFGEDGALDFVRTEFDFQIDAASSTPGKYVLDKMVSAANLGEIARLCLYKLATFGIILYGYTSPLLSMKDSLKTSDLAMMEMDEENVFDRCRAVMYSLGYKKVTNEDCRQIRFVGRCVVKRSAYLVAACLTGMSYRMGLKYINIMADGFLLKEFPNYENYLLKKILYLKKPNFRFQLLKTEKEDLAVGAGIASYIYKDEVIKLEDKHRILPPFNVNKYNLTNLPASCIDCNCEPGKAKASPTVETEEQSRKSSGSKTQSEVIEAAEPLVTFPFAVDD